jgi:diacylglycerol kinase (ATP)
MNHPHKTRVGMQRLAHATGYSMAGLAAAWRHERAFRLECTFAAVLVPAAWWLGRTWTETALLASSVLLVLVIELINSAIEAVVDRVSAELHPLSKRAKDIGSAAVMVSIIICAMLWFSAMWQRWST